MVIHDTEDTLEKLIDLNIFFLVCCAALDKNSRQVDLLIKKRRIKNI